uniref:hypothetical protein n=1 Tax=Nocardia takedensis TaxID=259390 RepID=UPI00059545BD
MTDDARKSAPHYDLDRVKAGRDLTINHTEHHYPAGAVSNAALLTGRSLYVSQVREFLAPVDGLRGRDHELEELAAFCRGEDPYLWIKAKPWAGKTALLSWFTLYPPQGVTVIGFFITDRLADQNTHTAFTAAIFDQLAVLLPDQRALIASATINRDGLRNELLTLAARHEADRGRRLVLVVDGLDEDTGKPPIVTLLPTRPDPNLRIVVASRHGPTLPISRKHPLITAETRPLRSSPFAADVREQALAELGALLHGSDNHRDLLALITTANGLTASELTDLTGMAPFEIDGLLHAVAGRSLRTRSHYSGPDGTGDPVYVLAHETLQRTAETALGTTYINRCLERLHAWADRYRDLAWPDDTPDFLLRRYFPILDKHNNYPRMTEAALDAARHDRMRTHTGGDVNALAEIRVVQQHICDQSDPDLLTAARLARHRDELHSRYEGISTALPATWARLGQPDRAATIARSISSFWHRADALARIATAIATTHPDRAENIARSITEPQQQAQALARIAGAIATTHPDRGENIARSIEDRWQQAQAHARIARAIAATDPDRAENIAHSITDLSRRVQAFAWIARAIATSDPVRAGQLTDQAEAITNNL